MNRAATIEGASLERLLENRSRFLSFVQGRVGSREAAEDILQDAYRRGLERVGELRDAESITAWFYRLLRNSVIDHYRHAQVEQRALERVARESAGSVSEIDQEFMDEICRCVEELLDNIKPEYAAAIRRIDLGGASVAEFAKEAHISANNAAVRSFRAREALRKQLLSSCGACSSHGCLDCHCRAQKAELKGSEDGAA